MLSIFSARKKRSMKEQTFVTFLNKPSFQYMQNIFPIFFISCSFKKKLGHRVLVLVLFFKPRLVRIDLGRLLLPLSLSHSLNPLLRRVPSLA